MWIYLNFFWVIWYGMTPDGDTQYISYPLPQKAILHHSKWHGCHLSVFHSRDWVRWYHNRKVLENYGTWKHTFTFTVACQPWYICKQWNYTPTLNFREERTREEKWSTNTSNCKSQYSSVFKLQSLIRHKLLIISKQWLEPHIS